MIEKNHIPFSAVLDSLFDDVNIPIQLLFRLSDLSTDELSQFDSRWPDVPEERRRVIIRHLADISEENFVVDFSPIFIRGINDLAESVRVAALDGIWDTTNLTVIDPVINLLQTDESSEVQAAAASALAHFILLAEWGQLPRSITPPIVEALLEEYERPGAAMVVKRAALEALSSSGHPRITTLIEEAYEGDDFDLRLSAVFAMGGSADPRWLPIILDEMSDPSPEMRAEAARAAGAISDREAVPELADLTADEELDVALAAVTALGLIGGGTASRILRQLADDSDFEALHEAVNEALEELEWLGGELDLLSFADTGEFEED